MSSQPGGSGQIFAKALFSGATVLKSKHVKHVFWAMTRNVKTKRIWKWLLIGSSSLLAVLVVVYFYFANLTHDDTASLRADYTVEAIAFIKEFEKDLKAANKKYAEKIIAVRGIVAATLLADTTMTIQMKDTTTGSYLAFDFQQQHAAEASKLKAGDNVVIKGSCSDGFYSDILGTYAIGFKRSTIEN